MPEQKPAKVYDLEERTYLFAKRVRAFVKTLPRSIGNFDCLPLLFVFRFLDFGFEVKNTARRCGDTVGRLGDRTMR